MPEATPGVDLTGKLQILAFAYLIIPIAASFSWQILSRREKSLPDKNQPRHRKAESGYDPFPAFIIAYCGVAGSI